jgi:non-homologous end joining protein Ku
VKRRPAQSRVSRKTGNRLKQQNVDSETGDVVPREDTARGYEVAKCQYLTVEDQEIDAVPPSRSFVTRLPK